MTIKRFQLTLIFSIACGNVRAAVVFIQKIGQIAKEKFLSGIDSDNWFTQISCSKTDYPDDVLICLRRKKTNSKCFLHKKSSKHCSGTFFSDSDKFIRDRLKISFRL